MPATTGATATIAARTTAAAGAAADTATRGVATTVTASDAAVMVLLFLLSATARRGSLRQCVGALADGRRREGVEGVAAHGNGRLPEGEQRGRKEQRPHDYAITISLLLSLFFPCQHCT